jgi:hypothetical protein
MAAGEALKGGDPNMRWSAFLSNSRFLPWWSGLYHPDLISAGNGTRKRAKRDKRSWSDCRGHGSWFLLRSSKATHPRQLAEAPTAKQRQIAQEN